MKPIVLTLVIVSIVATGCGEDRGETANAPAARAVDTSASIVGEPETVTTTELVISPENRVSLLADSAVSASRDGDWVGGEISSLRPGSPLFVAARMKDVPAGLVARATIAHEGEKIVFDQQKDVPAEGVVVFDAGDTGEWEKGSYEIEIYVGGTLSAEMKIEID